MTELNVTTRVMNTSLHKMTVAFKGNSKKTHKGVDLVPKATSETPEILAYDDGVVIHTQNLSGTNESTGTAGMGTSCAIKHPDGKVTRYQHLKYNSLKVKKGDKVKKGQTLGVYGRPTTGNSTGSHLHFDISLPSKPSCDYIKGTFCGETRYYVNPLDYLCKSNRYKVTASVLNVRSGAGTNYSKVGKLMKGDIVTVTDKKDGFGKIGAGQWVSLDYLTKI